MAIVVEIPGEPVAKGRARSTTKGHHYTPEKTRTKEGIIAALSFQAMAGLPPLAGPIKITFQAIMSIPQSWSAKKREAAISGLLPPTKRPDLDNLVKLATDGMNGIVWGDDSQITKMVAEKVYGYHPKTIVTVTPIGEGE